MKKICCFFLFILFFSCEEVIDVELPTSETRLVIDAIIGYNDNNGEPITIGQITLTLTAPFLNAEVQPARDAQVFITNEDTGSRIELLESEPGIFRDGFPNLEFGVDYTIEVIYQNNVYTATEQLQRTGEITSLRQDDGFLLDEEKETEIVVSFNDVPDERNYYLFAFGLDNYLVSDDEFYQNSSLTFSYFYEDLEPNDVITITLLGIDQQFANYVNLALVQAGEDGGGPFQVPTATVKGNIVNTTEPDNFPFGYFALGEFDVQLFTVE